MNNPRVKFIFLGSPEFSVHVLEAAKKKDTLPTLIITRPEKERGRGLEISETPVGNWARKHHIPLLTPNKLSDKSVTQEILRSEVEVGVIAAYGKILSDAFLALLPNGFLNIHPSLLPRHRGPTPIESAILGGDTETGISIMLTDKEMDHGPIIAQEKITIPSSWSSVELSFALATRAGALITDVLPKWVNGSISPIEQKHENATYTSLLTKDMARIDWNKPATHIERFIRALALQPTAWTEFLASDQNIRVKIYKALANGGSSFEKPGTLLKKGDNVYVVTGHGLIQLERVQLPGKRMGTPAPLLRFAMPHA